MTVVGEQAKGLLAYGLANAGGLGDVGRCSGREIAPRGGSEWCPRTAEAPGPPPGLHCDEFLETPLLTRHDERREVV